MNKIFSVILLILLSPILLIVSFTIWVDDGLPIFFRQKRNGKNNNIFLIYKFRTMKLDTEDIPTHLIKKNDILYTKFGPFLRKYSIDELPQLFNILRNEMCFIGPRPSLFNQYDLIRLRTSVNVHKLKPGITGWAQVNGRDEIKIQNKVNLDQFYYDNKSFVLDIKILFLTLIKVLKKEGIR